MSSEKDSSVLYRVARLGTTLGVKVRIPVDREHGFRLIVNINSSRS